MTSPHKEKCPVAFKVRYSTKKQAKGQVSVGRQKGLVLYFYKCDFCKDYHLTRVRQ